MYTTVSIQIMLAIIIALIIFFKYFYTRDPLPTLSAKQEKRLIQELLDSYINHRRFGEMVDDNQIRKIYDRKIEITQELLRG